MREIDENTIIKNGKSFNQLKAIALRASSPLEASFEEVFGDLSDTRFCGTFALDELDLISLKGCPAEVISRAKGRYISTQGNPSLTDLSYFPDVSNYIGTIFLSSHQLFSETRISKNNLEKTQHISLDWTIDFTAVDLVHFFLQLGEIPYGFSKIQRAFLPSGKSFEVENLYQIYNIYKKVNFDREKLNRTLALISGK